MISSLVELVSIEVTVIDGIWADMLTRPVMILMAILALKFLKTNVQFCSQHFPLALALSN